MTRPLRADAERSVQAILEASERVLARDPTASMEQIAEEAGLTRTTVHRRFATRQAIIDGLAVSAKQELADAIKESAVGSSPALVALHRVTENVLRVKDVWRFTLGNPLAVTAAASDIWADINAGTFELLERAQEEDLIDTTANLIWVRQVYYALLAQAIELPERTKGEYAALAALVIDTLLHGSAPRSKFKTPSDRRFTELPHD